MAATTRITIGDLTLTRVLYTDALIDPAATGLTADRDRCGAVERRTVVGGRADPRRGGGLGRQPGRSPRGDRPVRQRRRHLPRSVVRARPSAGHVERVRRSRHSDRSGDDRRVVAHRRSRHVSGPTSDGATPTDETDGSRSFPNATIERERRVARHLRSSDTTATGRTTSGAGCSPTTSSGRTAPVPRCCPG